MRPFFYVRTIERVHIALADMFNDIFVNKYSDLKRTQVVKTVKVPLVIGNYDKDFANFVRNVQKKKNMPVPIMGLRYSGIQIRSDAVPQLHYVRNLYSRKANKFIADAQPMPVEIMFKLDILTESWADYGQIIENIYPYFTNFRTLRIKEFEEYDDLESKVPVYFTAPSFSANEDYKRDASAREIKETLTLKCKAMLYRPRSTPGIIHQAELNLDADGTLGDFPITLTAIGYPTELAEQLRQPWETISPSIIPGYSVISSYSDMSSYIIPNFLELDLRFDEDTDFETDYSAWNRNFEFVTDPVGALRTFDSTMEPDGGMILTNSGYTPALGPETTTSFFDSAVNTTTNEINLPTLSGLSVGDGIKFTTFDISGSALPTGIVDSTQYYIIANDGGKIKISETDGGSEVDITTTGEGHVVANAKWNMLLTWFGTNNGLMEKPYVFNMSVKILENPITATVLQHTWNKTVGVPGDSVYIPENSVWYIWGIDSEQRMYFTFRTYGSDALFYTFRSDSAIPLNNDDVFTFKFTLTNEGHDGVFTYKINDSSEITLSTTRS